MRARHDLGARDRGGRGNLQGGSARPAISPTAPAAIGPSLVDDNPNGARTGTDRGRFEIIYAGDAGAMEAFGRRLDQDQTLQSWKPSRCCGTRRSRFPRRTLFAAHRSSVPSISHRHQRGS